MKVYKGHPEHASLERAQGNESIYCVDPAFGNYYCVSKEDLKTLLMCPAK